MQMRQEAQIPGKPRKRTLLRPTVDGFDLQVVAPTSLYHQATSHLRALIVEGDLVPGQRLVEVELCRRLGVSRTPLREALKVLAQEGLVDLLPNRGASVARMTAAEAEDLFTVIGELEGLAASICCRRISGADLARLELLHRQMLACHKDGNRHDYFALNDRIHRAVVALAGNPVLSATHERLIGRARRARFQALLASGRWDQSVGEHEELMAALRKRGHALAGRIWRRHLLATGASISRLIAQQVMPAAGNSQGD